MKQCLHCLKKYKPIRPYHMFCTQKCADAYNKGKTWENYFRKLLQNNKVNRQALTVKQLISLYKRQKGKCALSGVELTKITGKGVVPSNCSIDRIKPGGKYSIRNIRLVCTCVNSFRGNLTDKEFIWWCGKIVDNG